MPSPLVIKSRYEIKTVLGRGGMGVVYQAYDSLMKRDVAVKTLREVPDGTLVELFYRECTVLAGMVHPNVIEIFDMGEFEDADNVSKPFYVMPLLPGRTLHDLIYPSSSSLPASRCVDIVSQACRGLQAAHDRELLHRDIKPRNIFVMKDDAVKLIDFGVAHLMGSNSTGMRGTPQYMSPEQITFKPLERQSDIFSMATVCYEALTAVHPFLRNPDGRDSGSDIAAAITGYNPPLVSDLNPAVNRAVAQVVAKGMAKDPWNRFTSAAAFADALQKALRNEGTVKPNTAGVQIRIERARRSLDQKDFQFASEIIGELESEGHSDPDIRRIRGDLEAAVRREKTDRLIEAATRYFASDEFTLALRKVQEVLQIEPANPPALELKKKIEDVLTEQRVSELLKTAAECIDRAAFTGARQAIQDALKLRPNDARARQLLSEVDLRQKEILRQRQEQERLFQAAHAAWLGGKIKLAIASLEELTELTRSSYDPGERSNEYQEFYRRIRAEHEAVESALEQARDLLANGDFSGVQRISDRYLRKYPDHEDFMALAAELVSRREEEAKAYRASIVSRLAVEPNLNAQADILEEALNNRPKDEYFEQELARVRDKQKEVKAIVARARGLEKQQAFEPALKEWESLSTLYPLYPGLQEQITKARMAWRNQREQARSVWIKRITSAIENTDHETALRLLRDAEREFPADEELDELLARSKAQAQRFEAVNSLIEKGLAAAKIQQFEAAEQALGEAGELSRGVPSLLRSTGAALVQAGGQAIDAQWRLAKAFLDKALQIDSEIAIPAAMWRQVEAREREESVRNVLDTVDGEQSAGRLSEARERVERALSAYPNEPRLLSLLGSIDALIAENRRREEREAALQSLKSLNRELPTKENPADLRASVQHAKAIAGRYPGDPGIANLTANISEQSAAFEQAAAALARDETKSCIAACEEMLGHLPGYRLFLNLKLEAAIRDTQKVAEFLDKVERQLAAEPDLGKRAQILEAAVRNYPEEPYYQEELRLVRGKQDLVNAVVEQAQHLEANGWFAEALDRWQYLKTIYPTLPELEESIVRCSRLLEEKRERGRQQYLSSIGAAIDRREYASALQEFAKALVEFPEDVDLLKFGSQAREARDRRLRCEKLLEDGVDRLEASRFQEGQETLRKAVEVGAEDPSVAKSAASYLIEYAREALTVDLDRAEAMISDARTIHPGAQVPPDLQVAIGEARRKKGFDKCSRTAAAFEQQGDLTAAIDVAAEFLRQYPGDVQAESLRARLTSVQEELQRQAQRAKDLEELRTLEGRAATLVQRSSLLDLLDQTEQIARRNPRDQEVTVAASELCGILSPLAEIRHFLSEDRFPEAASLCTVSMERFPLYKPFADLQVEIQARQREQAAEYLRQVERKLSEEPDFRKHAAILNEALQAYPDEAYFLDELRLVRNKEALLEREIARARELEESELYEDARREWEALRSFYPWFAGLDVEIARVVRLFEEKKNRIANAWIGRIHNAIKAAQYQSASQALEDALADLPGEPRLLAFRLELENIRQKQAAARDAFTKGEALLEAGDVNEALASFNTALRLTPEDELRNSIAAVLLAKARERVNESWEEAQRLVAKIAEIQPDYQVPTKLRDEILQRRTAHELARTLQEIGRETENGNWVAARQLLERARPSFPNEPAIVERLQTVTAAIQRIEAERARAAALRSLADARSQLNSREKRPLARLRTSIQASPFLVSDDPEVRSSAQQLLSEIDANLQALESESAQRAERKKSVRAANWKAIRQSPVLLAAIAVAVAILGAAYWLLPARGLRSVALALSPDHVSVTVGGETCVTPACNLKLKAGEYRMRLARDGYIPQTVSLNVDDRSDAPVRLTATLLPRPPALQISCNMNDAAIYLDGARVGGANAGQFTLTSIPKGTHVLTIASESGKASLPLLSRDNGSLAMQGSISGVNLSVLAVVHEDEAENLVTGVLSPQPVYVDDQRVGITSGGLLRLPKLAEGAHQVQVGEAAGLLRFSLPASPRPSLYAFIAGRGDTGTLSVSINVGDADLIVDGKRYPAAASQGKFRLFLPAKTYEVHAERSGYLASDTVRATVDRSSETFLKLRLTPRPVAVEFRGLASETEIKIDGAVVGKISSGQTLRREISPGVHLFELLRDGFKTKRFQRKFEPGETALLTGSDVELTPAADPEALAWNKAGTGRLPELQDFLRKYPDGPHASEAAQKIQQMEWDAVDKQSLSGLRAYLSGHPQGSHTAQARQRLEGLQEAETLGAEQSDWNAVEKDSRKSAEDFLAKHPSGSHAGAAGRLLADLKNKEEAAQLDRAEASAWGAVNVKDRQALENFVKTFPSSRHRADADRALASLNTPKSSTSNTASTSPDESPAVLDAVQQLANAWNTKNSQAIFAAQPTLDKRAIKAQLEALQSIHIIITPLGAPQVSGDRAKLVCRRKVDQVFSDGTQKSLELPVTFDLVKNGSRWVIESAK